VRSTRVGWLAGREVVDVRFDPRVLALGALLERAREWSCAERVWVANSAALEPARVLLGERVELLREEPGPAKESDELYYLGRSPLRFLPLSPLQAQHVNAALGAGTDPLVVLSPRQARLAERIERRLERAPTALESLRRPASASELIDYTRELERRLGSS
jgi:hypothetical protein